MINKSIDIRRRCEKQQDVYHATKLLSHHTTSSHVRVGECVRAACVAYHACTTEINSKGITVVTDRFIDGWSQAPAALIYDHAARRLPKQLPRHRRTQRGLERRANTTRRWRRRQIGVESSRGGIGGGSGGTRAMQRRGERWFV